MPTPKCRFCGAEEIIEQKDLGVGQDEPWIVDVVHCPNGCKDPMSNVDHWCYQILKHSVPIDKQKFDVYYALHEVYKDKDGKIISYTAYPEVVGDTPQEVLRVLNMMRHDARTKPVVSAIYDSPAKLQSSLQSAIFELLESADETCCSDDLTVVSLKPLQAIYKLMKGDLAFENRWPETKKE
ncbi:MAG: hypothetical protein MN733_22230 [Nitrososphaera sp.]|nr:hypothetical protein [Nitrososphaera sp.]